MDSILQDIFNEFETHGKQKEISIKQVRDIMGERSESIVLYGAGSAGIALAQYLRGAGFDILAFTDGSPKKWGSVVEGLEVIAPEELSKRFKGPLFIIVTINTDGKQYCRSFEEALRVMGHQGVHKLLHDLGHDMVVDYPVFRRCYELFKGDKYNLPSCSDVYCMQRNKDKIEEALSLFEEPYSREVYYSLLRFRLLDDSIPVPTTSAESDYFEYDLYSKIYNENFVDCGAYDGNTLARFLTYTDLKFNSYTALEPDSENIAKFEKRVAAMALDIQKKITLFPEAVWRRKGELSFYELKGPGSFAADLGNRTVPCTDLDSVLKGKEPTLIKMNIEGSEKAALEGARNIISDCRPVLVIANYHKTWDLWELPLIMKEMYAGYKFYLRSYMNHISFKCYAVPPERCTNL